MNSLAAASYRAASMSDSRLTKRVPLPLALRWLLAVLRRGQVHREMDQKANAFLPPSLSLSLSLSFLLREGTASLAASFPRRVYNAAVMLQLDSFAD